jgi:hypothetical protein
VPAKEEIAANESAFTAIFACFTIFVDGRQLRGKLNISFAPR